MFVVEGGGEGEGLLTGSEAASRAVLGLPCPLPKLIHTINITVWVFTVFS